MKENSYSSKVIGAYTALSEWIVRGIGQPPTWPRNVMEWVYFQSRFFPRTFLAAARKLEKDGAGPHEMAKLLRYPTSVTHWLYFPECSFGASNEY